jgi:hypothetical protein
MDNVKGARQDAYPRELAPPRLIEPAGPRFPHAAGVFNQLTLFAPECRDSYE